MVSPTAVPGRSFTQHRNRDAWFVIRGFVRQVDDTIEQWISLTENQALELERGEDIDVVSRALATEDASELERLLIQIKQREDSLTLRSPEAVEAIANFVEQRAANPGLSLRFRLLTNATVGQERPSAFSDVAPALSRWEAIRKGQTANGKPVEAKDQEAWLSGMRQVLTEATKPDGFAQKVWDGLQEFLAWGNAELLAVVRTLEWATGATGSDAMSGRIIGLLTDRGHAANEISAKSLYDRLFVHVFKLLTTRGIKRLTPTGYSELRSLPTISPDDQKLLARVEDRLLSLESRVGSLETLAVSVDARVSALAEELPQGLDLQRETRDMVALLLQRSEAGLAGGNREAEEAKRELAAFRAKEFLAKLRGLLNDWEFHAAFAAAKDFRSWIADNGSQLLPALAAECHVRLAEAELTRVKQRQSEETPVSGEDELRLSPDDCMPIRDLLQTAENLLISQSADVNLRDAGVTQQELSQEIASMRAYLTWMEAGIDTLLKILPTAGNPFAIRRQLARFLDSKQYDVAAALARGHSLHPEWADKAAAAFAGAGDVDAVLSALAWARMYRDTPSLAVRCAVHAGQVLFAVSLRPLDLQGPMIKPGQLPAAAEAGFRAVLTFVEPVTAPIKLAGHARAALDESALLLEVVVRAWLGEHTALREAATVLGTYCPFPILLAQLAQQHLLLPLADWPDRLRTEHPGDFDAHLLAAIVEGELKGREKSAFDAALMLVRPDLTLPQGKQLLAVLQQIASQLPPEAGELLPDLTRVLVPGEERHWKLVEASRLLHRGDTAEAAPLLESTRDAGDANWLQLHAQLLLQQGEGEKALEELIHASILLPHPDLLLLVATVAAEQKRYQEAVGALNAVLTYTPDAEPVRRQLALLAVSDGDFPTAAEHFGIIWRQDQSNIRNGINYAVALSRSGNMETAADVYGKIAALDGAPLILFVESSGVLKALGRPTEAFAALQLGKDRYGDDPDYLRAVLDLGYTAGEEEVANQAMLRLRQMQAEGTLDPATIQEKSIDQMVEFIVGRHSWQEEVIGYVVAGRFPWLTADHLLGDTSYGAWYSRTQPIKWMMDSAIARARYCVYSTNGFRGERGGNHPGYLAHLVCAPKGQAVVADVSALFTLDQLGLLSHAASYFGRIVIPVTYLSRVTEDAGRLVPHQLSKKTTLDAIRSALDERRIAVVGTEDVRDMLEVSEYGGAQGDAEDASSDAQSPYRLRDILEALDRAGRITEEQRKASGPYLTRPSASGSGAAPLAVGASILIELSTLSTLTQMGLLEAATSAFGVHLSRADSDEAAATLRSFTYQEEIRSRHKKLWDMIRGDSRFSPVAPSSRRHGVALAEETDHNNEIDIAAPLLACQAGMPLLADDRVCQMIALNDPSLPQQAFGTDRLIVALEESGLLSADQAADAFLQLIRWRYRFLVPPVSILRTLAHRFTHPPGQFLQEIALYAHDCLRDEGLFHVPEHADTPNNNCASRLFFEWAITTGGFVAEVWANSEAFSETRAEGLTEWAVNELLPSHPHVLRPGGQVQAPMMKRLVFAQILFRSTGRAGVNRMNRGLRAGAAALGVSKDEYTSFLAEAIHAI